MGPYCPERNQGKLCSLYLLFLPPPDGNNCQDLGHNTPPSMVDGIMQNPIWLGKHSGGVALWLMRMEVDYKCWLVLFIPLLLLTNSVWLKGKFHGACPQAPLPWGWCGFTSPGGSQGVPNMVIPIPWGLPISSCIPKMLPNSTSV